MKLRASTITLLALLILGCATPEQREARIAEHMQRDLSPICTTAGRTPGTDAHSRCVITLYREELADAVTIAAAPSESAPVTCTTYENVTICN